MGFSKSFRKLHSKAFKSLDEITGQDTLSLFKKIGGDPYVRWMHDIVGRDVQRFRDRQAEQDQKNAFDAITRLVATAGGDRPQKVNPTATTVKAARGRTTQPGRRGVFVIPRNGRRNLSTTRMGGGGGVSVPKSRGLNIAI